MKQLLSAEATEASRQRATLASQMAESCPQSWRLEIALTGSASRGVAGAESDIELNFWGHVLPTAQERQAWLAGIGATDVALAVEVTACGTTWDRWRFRDIWVEAGWQPIPLMEANLRRILAGETLDHAQLVLAEVVSHAIPLGSHGSPQKLRVSGEIEGESDALSSWQVLLAHYPDALQQRLIDSVLEQWSSPYTTITRWLPVRKNRHLSLAKELVSDVQAVLRLLFALNREWEPDWKWISVLAQRLQRKPDQLIERIAGCFEQASPVKRMRTCTQLILDAVSLLPQSRKIEEVRDNLQRGLGLYAQPIAPLDMHTLK
jgi:hypothetical protein